MNATMHRFGYPGTLIREFDHWAVLLRPKQVTLGSLVVTAKSGVTAWPELPLEAFAELRQVTGELEQVLRTGLGCEKVNYLMLMMVDPHVHFHVLPRYPGPQAFAGLTVPDTGWPKPPDLQAVTAFPEEGLDRLREHLKGLWPA